MTTITAELRADSGMDTEHIDSKTLSAAAAIVSEAANGLLASRGDDDWIILMLALGDLTRAHAEDGDPQPLFAVAQLRDKCASLDPVGKVYWLSDEDTGRKKFSKAWEKLEASFPGLEGNLQQRAERRRIPARAVAYVTSDGQDKRTKLYGLRCVRLQLPEISEEPTTAVAAVKPVSSPEGSIEYVEEMEIYPFPGFRHPVRINVQGWRSLFMVAPVVIVLMVVFFGLWVILQVWLSEWPVRKIAQGTFTIVIFVGILAWFVWPLYRLTERRIIMAPGILQLNSRFQHVLVIRKEDNLKVVRMVRFTGACPLCGGLVEIQKGYGRFRGRFVGECERNPIEHLYSFDHVLRRGFVLRPTQARHDA